MRTHFYNAKVKGVWQEVYTEGERGDKKKALEIFKKFDENIKLKDVYSCINTPYGCPETFTKHLNDLL